MSAAAYLPPPPPPRFRRKNKHKPAFNQFYEQQLRAARLLAHKRLLADHSCLRHPSTHIQFMAELKVPDDHHAAFTLNVGRLHEQWPECARFIYFVTHPSDAKLVAKQARIVGRADLLKQNTRQATYLNPVLCEGRANLRHPFWRDNTLKLPDAYEPGSWAWLEDTLRPTNRESNIRNLELGMRRRLRILSLFKQRNGHITDYSDYQIASHHNAFTDIMAVRMFTPAARECPPYRQREHVNAFWDQWAAAERRLARRRLEMHFWKRLIPLLEMIFYDPEEPDKPCPVSPAIVRDMDHSSSSTQRLRGWYRVPFEMALQHLKNHCIMSRGNAILHYSQLLDLVVQQWDLCHRPGPTSEVQLSTPIAWKIPPGHAPVWRFQYQDVVLPRLKELYDMFKVHTQTGSSFDYVLPQCLKKINDTRPHLKFGERQVYGRTMAALRTISTFPSDSTALIQEWAPTHQRIYKDRKTDLAAVTSQWKSIYNRRQHGASCREFITCGLCPYATPDKAGNIEEEKVATKRCVFGPFWRAHPKSAQLNRPGARTVVEVGKLLAHHRRAAPAPIDQ